MLCPALQMQLYHVKLIGNAAASEMIKAVT